MDVQTFQTRRKALRHALPEGVILLPGNEFAARNYADNTYPSARFPLPVLRGTDHAG